MASDDEFEFEFDEMPLLLTAPGPDYAGPVVLRSAAAFVSKAVEPAGSAYHARWCAKFAKPLKVKKARVEQSYAELEAEDAGMSECVGVGVFQAFDERVALAALVLQPSGAAWPRSWT